MTENITQHTPPRVRRLKVPLLFLCLLTSGSLWLYSGGLYYRPLPPPVFSITAHNLIFQICSEREAIHTILMWCSPSRPSAGFLRATHYGRSGYLHGLGIDLGGFVLRLLPRTFSGGDYILSPHIAIVVPYWATTTGVGLLLLWVSGFHCRLRPYMRFSKYPVFLMSILSLAIVLANIYPWTTHHEGILRDYGFPRVYLRQAVQGSEPLTFFMGYDLGWRQARLVENVLFGVLIVLAAGMAMELSRYRFTRKRQS